MEYLKYVYDYVYMYFKYTKKKKYFAALAAIKHEPRTIYAPAPFVSPVAYYQARAEKQLWVEVARDRAHQRVYRVRPSGRS